MCRINSERHGEKKKKKERKKERAKSMKVSERESLWYCILEQEMNGQLSSAKQKEDSRNGAKATDLRYKARVALSLLSSSSSFHPD